MDRKHLSILRLTEDRDYVTYDELVHTLEWRPSNAVYIERDGILCGLITSGHIRRNHNEKTRRVIYSKKFTYVHPGEYMRAREIFRNRINIHALPVVLENGHLLAGYIRWDDLLGTDYAELLCRDPYVLQNIKNDIHRTIFVKPTVHGGGTLGLKMFSWWIQRLESEGIHPQVIEHREIKDYFKVAQNFLFIGEDQKCAIEVLSRYLYRYNESTEKSFLTIPDYLCRMRYLADMSFLKELQNQGISFLTIDFKENSNQFLAVLDEKIRKRMKEHGVGPGNLLPETLKKSFADELYCEAYKEQIFPLPLCVHTYHTQPGIPYFRDAETEFYHIQNGERLTMNQPEKYDRCIYLYGPCVVTGTYVSDQYTIASLLQSEINQAGFSCKVVNRGFPGDRGSNADRLHSAPFKQGDIVIFDQYVWPVEDYSVLNLIDALEKCDAPADWFFNSTRHSNHKANRVYAHEIYKTLLPVLQQPPKERTTVNQNHDNYIDHFYLRHYFSAFYPAGHGTIGSIVMNCNPFTLGHRFLIEEALKTVDFLIVFVVEEDNSFFSFGERFNMVCQGIRDIEHIMVVPSGPYILSRNTFPEYFQKVNDEDLRNNTENDIMLFAEKIAPKLGITYRFVGEELEDKVTNEYNDAMKRILPRYGIQVVEIPRKTNGRSVISASRVRQCLSENHMEELNELVPASTKCILFFEDK